MTEMGLLTRWLGLLAIVFLPATYPYYLSKQTLNVTCVNIGKRHSGTCSGNALTPWYITIADELLKLIN
jgi:hypothetical protein